MDELARELEKLGYTVDLSYRQHGVVALKDFEIQVGQHAGKMVTVGIPAPNYPIEPPAGLHFRPHLASVGQNNINPSPLGADWQYWSRRLTDWRADRSAHHVISYVNKVLIDA